MWTPNCFLLLLVLIAYGNNKDALWWQWKSSKISSFHLASSQISFVSFSRILLIWYKKHIESAQSVCWGCFNVFPIIYLRWLSSCVCIFRPLFYQFDFLDISRALICESCDWVELEGEIRRSKMSELNRQELRANRPRIINEQNWEQGDTVYLGARKNCNIFLNKIFNSFISIERFFSKCSYYAKYHAVNRYANNSR